MLMLVWSQLFQIQWSDSLNKALYIETNLNEDILILGINDGRTRELDTTAAESSAQSCCILEQI